MRSDAFRVSIVIPSYNGRYLLEQHLPSVVAAMGSHDELVVVDDASTDDTHEWFPQWVKQQKLSNRAQLLALPTNRRFAAATNLGVSAARGQYVFVLNNDVEPSPDVLQHLLAVFAQRHDVFGVGCLEYEGAMTADALRSGKNRLWFERGLFHHGRAREFSAGPTAWVSGGSGLFDRQKFLALGGFDERFTPAYWEDVDLSFRARQHGWYVGFEPKATVVHLHETTNKSAFGEARIQDMSWRNAFRFTWKNATWWQTIEHMCWLPYWWFQRARHNTFVMTTALCIAVLFMLGTVMRLAELGNVPHGFGWDEAAIGYNGFAILTTRRDEWLQRLPISFQSFGDYKAPLSIYLNGVFTWAFGMTPLAVRLPFALAGLATMVGVVLFVHELLLRNSVVSENSGWQKGPIYRYLFVGLAVLLASSSVWHTHYSRIAFESGISLSFLIWGMVFWAFGERMLIRISKQKGEQQVAQHAKLASVFGVLLLSGTCFVASMYAYHAAKIVAPVLWILFTIWGRRTWKKYALLAFVTFLCAGAALWPMVQDSVYGKGGARLEQSSLLGLHLAPDAVVLQTAQHVWLHFLPDFLVGGKTDTLRHGNGEWGVLFVTEYVLWLFGLSSLIYVGYLVLSRSQLSLKEKAEWRVVGALALSGFVWMMIGILPAAIGRDAPHSNRALLSWPGFLLLMIAGAFFVIRTLRDGRLSTIVLGSHGEKDMVLKTVVGGWLLMHLLLWSASGRTYFTQFAQQSAADFQDGYLEAMQLARSYEPDVDKILFTSKYGQPYIFALFVRKTNPIWYRGGSLVKYEFNDRISAVDRDRSNTLIIATPEEIPPQSGDQLIYGSDHMVRFVVVEPK